MKIKEKLLGIIVLIFIFGGIFISSAMDLWITEGHINLNDKTNNELTDDGDIDVVKEELEEEHEEPRRENKKSEDKSNDEETHDVVNDEEVKIDEDKLKSDPNLIYNDGIYTGISRGYKSDIEVRVEIKSDIIVSVEIESHKESRGYYEEVFATIPGNIVKSQSTNVDTISGATFTSDAVIDATNQALDKAKK